MTEVKWKSLECIGYPMYMVSSEGNVKSVKTGKLIKPWIGNHGYYSVCLCNEGEHKRFLLHRLVALTFIPNEGNLPQINHINQVKTDNRVDNLEWCDMRYNLEYSKCNSPVSKYNTQGELLYTYWSVSEAARCNGLSIQALLRYLNGHLVSNDYYGFIYRYEGQNPLEPIRNDEVIKRGRKATKLYKLVHKESVNELNRKYYQKNKERVQQYQQRNKEHIKEQRHERYQKNKEQVLEKQREYRQVNKERIKEKRQEYYQKNKERVLEQMRDYYRQNDERIKEQKRQYRLRKKSEQAQ